MRFEPMNVEMFFSLLFSQFSSYIVALALGILSNIKLIL